MPGSLLGTRVRRVEDPELLRGAGTYVGNLRVNGLADVHFVRSPIAHGRIVSVDTDAAATMPGVLAVYVAADLGLSPFHGFAVLNPACARPPLAEDKVRFVGEAVAAVVAETAAQAADAAEAVVVDYDPLPAVVDPEDALVEGAPLQFEDLGTNLVAGLAGDGPDPLEGAATVVRGRIVNQRIAVVPLEGNAIVADPTAEGYDLTVHVSTQMPHGFHRIASRLLGIDPPALRVIAPHVGGGFGSKAGPGAEHLVTMAAARRLGRPLRWVETRSENFVAMPHGRGQVQWVEMGFDGDGRITGMHCRVLGDAGAYAGFGGALAMGPTKMMSQGVYRIPRLRCDVAVAVTNTTPMGAFRGAGRPEAAEFLERIMDLAASRLGLDPAELRRRNLIGPDEFPYTTQVGTNYDSGDYQKSLDQALRLADYEALREEQARRRTGGDRWQLGIGVSTYVEVTAGGMPDEFGAVEVHPNGRATVRAGTSAHGQGHGTAFAMLVSDRLGIPMENIDYVQSDTASVPRGSGTGGSRSLQIGGNAVRAAADLVWDKARRLAADHLEAAPEDIVVHDDGRVGVSGVPASARSWSELAAAAQEGGDPLAAETDFHQEGATFPFGAHVSVVEVDRETGQVLPLRHVAVDDCGRILNPLLVAGQQHGGIAQGMAQALWEEVRFDEDGNPLTANLADYGMPSSAEVPSFDAANTETPTPRNPLGAKGIGESGTIGSTPSVHNAVIDALSPYGVRHIDIPCTPQKIWQALQEAARREGAPEPDPWRDPPTAFAGLPTAAPRPEAANVDI
ncbi:MAG: xanthine dehydrogenase family protein [Acidimicrobiaceae bacterium]|nr:xanthine dehydrogenase family protein [Acidimicrobiaceae bacterium]